MAKLMIGKIIMAKPTQFFLNYGKITMIILIIIQLTISK
jgi:hypothetical protein